MNFTKVRNRVQKYAGGDTIAKETAETILGFIPGVGEVMDVVGLVRGLLTGNLTDAAFSAIGLFTPGSGVSYKAAANILKSADGKLIKAINNNTDEIAGAASIINNKNRSIREATDALKTRIKTGLLKKNTSEIGDLSKIDTRSEGFLDKLKSGEHGYDIDEMLQQKHNVLDADAETGSIISLLRNTDPKDQEKVRSIIEQYDLSANQQKSKRLFAGALTFDLNHKKGTIENMPRIMGGESVTPEHVFLGSTSAAPKQGVMMAGYHGNKSHTYNPKKTPSQSGNLHFLADSAAGAAVYSQMDPKLLKKIIEDLPEGKAKDTLADAFEFTELFDSMYLPKRGTSGIEHHLSNNIPANAFIDSQFSDYIKAKQLLTKIYPQTNNMGGIHSVLIPELNMSSTLVVNGKGNSHLDFTSLLPEDYTIDGKIWMPNQRFGSLTAGPGSKSVGDFLAVDPTFASHRSKKMGKNFAHYKHLQDLQNMLLKDVGNNVLGNQIGIPGQLYYKYGGKLNYFNY